MSYSKEKHAGVEEGLNNPTPSPPRISSFFSLLETPQTFVITSLGDFKT